MSENTTKLGALAGATAVVAVLAGCVPTAAGPRPVAFDGVQTSPHYPGGVALRFARVKGYRPDKRAEEADSIDAVRALLPEASRA